MNEILKEIEEKMIRCIKCGECQAVCPVFKEEQIEGYVARGKIKLLRTILNGQIDFTEAIQRRIDECLNCNACFTACPPGIDVDEIIITARHQMRKNGIPLSESLKIVKNNILEKNNPFGLPAQEKEQWILKDIIERKSENLFFAGCSISYSQNKVAKASLRVLDMAGIGYTTLGNDEMCCGDPLLRMGEVEEYERLREINLRKFKDKGIKVIFTSCAGCVKSLKKDFGDKFEVYHTLEFLEKLAKERKIEFDKEFKKKVVYFDGCDIGRHAGIFEAPRELLKRVPGLELLEFPKNRENSECCGGPFMASFPDLAKNIAAKRIKGAMDLGVDTIAVACPTCLLNLKEGAKLVDGSQIDIQDVSMIVQKCVKKK